MMCSSYAGGGKDASLSSSKLSSGIWKLEVSLGTLEVDLAALKVEVDAVGLHS